MRKLNEKSRQQNVIIKVRMSVGILRMVCMDRRNILSEDLQTDPAQKLPAPDK